MDIGRFTSGNVVTDGGRHTIIPFSDASMDHISPGILECHELLDAQDMLQVVLSLENRSVAYHQQSVNPCSYSGQYYN
jgi:hypothetical protein